MRFSNKKATSLYILSCALAAPIITTNAQTYDDKAALEEVIVTAQKREQNRQDTPLAISVLDDFQLSSLAITSLDDLSSGIIPSLRISPNGNTSSSLTIAIRGDGPSDVVQTTRQSSVAVHQDGIYLGRAQGLSMELLDTERVEILRGPQGTLFGRNSTSGAINIISKKPTGEWGIKQTISTGNYGLTRSITRLNTGEFAGLTAKLDYLYTDIDGWVENAASGQSDYNESTKSGGRLSVNWAVLENITIDYALDISDIKSTQSYFQIYKDVENTLGREPNRETKTRFPVPLKPADVDQIGHSLIANWVISDNVTLRSLSAYRELDEDGFNNYGGALFNGGLIIDEDILQEQYSQEFQLIGSYEDVFEWVTGVFYFKEDGNYDGSFLFSLGPNFVSFFPPVSNPMAPASSVINDAESIAVYGQGTLSLSKKLDLTAGIRYTQDDKTAARIIGTTLTNSPNIDSEHTDASIALSYQVLDNISTYARLASAYKAGGYNVRSATFLPYGEEVNTAYEIGMKSEWFNRQLRLNAALFQNQIKDKQFDFANPLDVRVVETLNAVRDVDIGGFEIDLSAALTSDLLMTLQYTYLDGDMPLQPHPQIEGNLQAFELIQTPNHAGAITIDYSLATLPIGVLNAHLDVTSTSKYADSTAISSNQSGFTLINARLALTEVPLGENSGNLSIALWGKNLADKEYSSLRFPTALSTIQAFGTPRTVGIDVTYEY